MGIVTAPAGRGLGSPAWTSWVSILRDLLMCTSGSGDPLHIAPARPARSSRGKQDRPRAWSAGTHTPAWRALLGVECAARQSNRRALNSAPIVYREAYTAPPMVPSPSRCSRLLLVVPLIAALSSCGSSDNGGALLSKLRAAIGSETEPNANVATAQAIAG